MKTQIREKNGITILEPNGKIMGNSASEFKKTISPQIETSNKPRILINLLIRWTGTLCPDQRASCY